MFLNIFGSLFVPKYNIVVCVSRLQVQDSSSDTWKLSSAVFSGSAWTYQKCQLYLNKFLWHILFAISAANFQDNR